MAGNIATLRIFWWTIYPVKGRVSASITDFRAYISSCHWQDVAIVPSWSNIYFLLEGPRGGILTQRNDRFAVSHSGSQKTSFGEGVRGFSSSFLHSLLPPLLPLLPPPTSFSLFCSPLPTTLCVCQPFCLSLSLNPTMPGTANVMTLDFRDFSHLELCPRNLETFLSVLTTLTCIYAKYNPAQNSCTKQETA